MLFHSRNILEDEKSMYEWRDAPLSYSRYLLVSDHPVLVLLFLYLQTVCNPPQKQVICHPPHAILPLLTSSGETQQGVPGLVLQNRGYCLHALIERGKAAGMPARRGYL